MRWIKILYLVILLTGIAKFLQLVIASPVGAWDAWAIWNLKAKFILAGSPNIMAPEIGYSHTDYPLLLPFIVASGWRIVGSTTPLVPVLMGFLVTWGTVAVLFMTIIRLQPAFIAWLLTIILITMPDFIVVGAWQVADVPLALLNLGSVAAMTLYAKHKNIYWLVLVGTLAGTGLNLKNEGLLFLVCFVLIYSSTLFQSRRGFMAFAVALMPWLITLLYFKFTSAISNDVVNSGTKLTQLFDLNRHQIILAAFGSKLSVLLLSLASVFCVIRLYQRFTLKPVKPFLLFLMILAGYYCIYLITPLDLNYHLDSSLNRLLIHIFPIALLGAALSITPHEPSQTPGLAK